MIQLFKHQREALERSYNKQSFAYFLETGTGKTYLALKEMLQLKRDGKITSAIITAPKTVLKPVWLKSMDDVLEDLSYYVFQWIGTITDNQSSIFNNLMKFDSDPDVMPIFLINIEAFSHKRVYEIVTKVIKRWKTLWIVDESTTIKNIAAKRTKGILAISHWLEYKRILSGYPVLKSPEDLYSQIQFLGPSLIPQRSYYSFRNQFCILEKIDRRIMISKGPKNVTELNELLQKFSIRILKKDCLDLPDKVRTIRYVDMTSEQRQYYNEMKRMAYVELRNIDKQVFTSTLLAQLEKLRQIANGIIVMPMSNNISFPCHKYGMLANIIKDEIPDQQVVIWSTYVETLSLIQEKLADESISCKRIYGAGSEAVEIEDDFIAGKFQCLIANPAGFRFGHNWVNAHYAIYFNNSFNLEYRIQSEDRLHRIGQTNKVTYIDLLTEDTIEERILNVLERNHSVGAAILKDEWQSWFN